MGAKNSFSFDIGAACSGFLYALQLGTQFIQAGTHKKVIVVGADKMSAIVDYQDRTTCILFGDGAGAVVLGPSQEGYIVSQLQANGNGTGMTGFNLSLDKPFVMRGKEVWDQAIKVLPPSITKVEPFM